MNKNPTKENIKVLLNLTENKLTHQAELRKIKGETFNIFTILGVEHYENKTHSNFIAELLDPEGSHLLGPVFLEEFISSIKHESKFSTKKAKVIKEFHIAKKSKDEGGRIDILIEDANKNLISIENKIYAGDQENQLIRYTNYKKESNTVYYLTLFGEDASEYSTKDETNTENTFNLKSGEDYYTISYANDILKWLLKCQQLATDIPQLREAIKQYALLIKKLTNQTMDNKEEMIELLFQNHEATKYIHENFKGFREEIQWRFREDVVKLLQENLDTKFVFRIPNPVHRKPIAQIFVSNSKLGIDDYIFEILIESFNDQGHHDGKVFIGVLDYKNKYLNYPDTNADFIDEYWKNSRFIKINNKHISFRDNNFLKQISNPKSDIYSKILNEFVTQCVLYINEHSLLMEESVMKN